MADKMRLNVNIKPETFRRVKALAEKLGMTQTGVAFLAIEAGLDALSMSLDPQFKEFFNRMAEHAEYNETDREPGVLPD